MFPIGGDGSPNALSFFQNYLGAVVLVIFYVGHKLYTRNWSLYIKVQDIDIDADRTIYDPEILELENLESKQRFNKAPFWKKILIYLFD